MPRRGLELLTTLVVVLALLAGQVSWFELDPAGSRGPDDSSYRAHDSGIDAVLPSERSRARLPIGLRAIPPEKAPPERGESAVLLLQNAARPRFRHPERRAVRLHRPRMHAGDDRPPDAMTHA